MLILSRKPGEQITIGDDIVITVVETRTGGVRLGINAPLSLSIRRPDATRNRTTRGGNDRTDAAERRTDEEQRRDEGAAA